MKQTNYGLSKIVNLSYGEAIEKVTSELQKEGFGILTEIDVKATLKKKLDVDFNEYKILGACNPTFAYKALQVEEEIGLLLPCNVIVYVNADQKTVVSAIDPSSAMQVVNKPEMEEFAGLIKDKLTLVITNV